ncbi:AmmeMemoRadiSam system protein B [Omnitrophica bacterium]|nr:AmmeMemoRadiSam system protein B [Candidatus Omnitrophota bacterium]
MLIRKPHVAGSFYPADAGELRQFCSGLEQFPEQDVVNARAVILPHAGYIYSSRTAIKVLQKVQVPQTVFMIGPDHRQQGGDFSAFADGQWNTPLGEVPVDKHLGQAVLKQVPLIRDDPQAHTFEHSLEVIVPLLQCRNPEIQMLPLLVGTLDTSKAQEAAEGLADVLAGREDIMLVISTDMSHYEEDQATRKKDRFALEAIENLDAQALLAAVKAFRITMCGFIPVYMLLLMAERLGIRKATLADYRTSADASGDRERVVGYAGFYFE